LISKIDPEARSIRRLLAGMIATLLFMSALFVVRSAVGPPNPKTANAEGSGSASGEPIGPGTQEPIVDSEGQNIGGSANGIQTRRGAKPGSGTTRGLGARTPAPGITNTEVTVAYYWKAYSTQASPYLNGTGTESAVDEAESFRHLVAYINSHAAGGATFMGFPFNLHGRKLKGVVLDAGRNPTSYGQTAEKIVKEIKPFAAVSAHGSLSSYICPRLAEARIHNMTTYDLAPGIGGRTNGYCLPAGMSWDSQVDWVVPYLSKNAATTRYQGTALTENRVYGIVYAEYPGMVESVASLVPRLKKAGVPIAAVESVSADLATAQTQTGDVIARFKNEGVNTVVAPEAGSLINFTHASQANAYSPDYFVWPCSGQDAGGQVRLYNAIQWGRASGLSCFDAQFNLDLFLDDNARASQWYKQYQESARDGSEPPASTPMVYLSLLPLVVGLTNAGPVVTIESFREGLGLFEPYRYNAIIGRTNRANNLMLTIGARDSSPIGDVGKVQWSNTTQTQGNPEHGAYLYPEDRRYSRGSNF